MPMTVEKRVVIRVGKMTAEGLTLPSAVLSPIIEVGISCKEVAFSTNSMHESRSALGVLSKSIADFTPYGVPAPEMPNILTDIFIQIASNALGSLVTNSRFAIGFNSLEIWRETPLSSQTRISPSHTE